MHFSKKFYSVALLNTTFKTNSQYSFFLIVPIYKYQFMATSAKNRLSGETKIPKNFVQKIKATFSNDNHAEQKLHSFCI